jgi:TrpR-related protein YerC/YecD
LEFLHIHVILLVVITSLMQRQVDLTTLVEAFLSLKNKHEIESFLSDILTKSEQETLIMRLRVARMLEEGLPYKHIEKETGASSATIAKISEYLRYGYDGYRTVITKTKV